MKKLFLFLLRESVCVCVCAQNLVINPGFEQYDTCPTNLQQIYFAAPWFQPCIFYGNVINSSSTDFFDACTNGNADVPNNLVGYQFARTGVGYAGIIVFINNNNKEYLEGVLIDTLGIGKKYCIEFYVSLADKSYWATSNIGLYFSQDSILSANYNVLPYSPQIFNPVNNILNDTSSWEKISGIYLADGGEKFITIGNFYPDSLTTLDTMSGTNPAYYYIDDVSVTLCTDTCQPPVAKFNYSSNELTASFYNLTSDVCSDCNWFWYFGDGNSDTSKNPVHIYDSAGIYTATFLACNQTGCCNELCCDTMVGQVSVSVGVAELQNADYQLQIYPNPASGSVTIAAKGGDKIIITDITGRKIKEYKISLNQLKINTDEYDNGIYFLCLYSDGRVAATEKMVIVK